MSKPSSLQMGRAGELLVLADLAMKGIDAIETTQNMHFDILAEVGGLLLKIQVKAAYGPSSEAKSRIAYRYKIQRGCNKKVKYADTDYDILALVALDTKQIAYIPKSDKRSTIYIELKDFEKLNFWNAAS